MQNHIGTFVILLTMAAFARAQLEVPRDNFEFDGDLNGRGEKMHYGPFLAYTLINAQRDPPKNKKDPGTLHLGLLKGKEPSIALRAINIHLGGKYNCSFDTEMCSYAAVWAGGPLDISRTNLNGYKGIDLGYLRLPALLQNPQLPGWSLDGKFDDPRPNKYGALPKTHAHYKGLYLHGYKTILSYTVGQANVFEMPGMLVKGKDAVFYRDIQLAPSRLPRTLFLTSLAGASFSVDKNKNFIRLQRDRITLLVGVRGLPSRSHVELGGNDSIVLALAPTDETVHFKIFHARDVAAEQFTKIMDEAAARADLVSLCKGGPPRWTMELTTAGTVGPDNAAYVVDTIPLPDDNPWHSWMRPSALDFLRDGRAVVCTWNGDAWLASGLDDSLKKVSWRRFATGLFEPLGVKVVKDQIYVLGRDQITRLHDLNGDGEADFYENFNNDGPTAPSFHSFAIELDTDQAGNFYYLRGAHRAQVGTPMHGGVIKVAADGSNAEILCSGLREPNGMAISPTGLITVADNQGNWVPSSKIDIIKKGGFYGYVWDEKPPYPVPEKPLCWIPMKEDNSSGSQVWVTSKKWGPLHGELLHTSYGTCKLFHVLMQKDGDKFQGGVVAFPLEFPTGIMRARFSPTDGQLYVCGLKGWGTSAKTDGGFYRVRYTGKSMYQATALRIHPRQIAITFTAPLDRESVKPSEIKIQQWNYRWTSAYGSKDYSVANPKIEARDDLKITFSRLSADGKTLTLTVPDLQPVMQMSIEMPYLTAADGRPMPTTIHNTVNYVP